MLSVAVLRALRDGTLPGVDRADPGAVCRALNAAFPAAAHGGRYFTLWYGVYHTVDRTLTQAFPKKQQG
jgi:sigma-B regulation protein RsbU (phosphoserine phosphatase)